MTCVVHVEKYGSSSDSGVTLLTEAVIQHTYHYLLRLCHSDELREMVRYREA